MPIYFLDSSALVKRYVREAGTGWVTALFPPFTSGRVTVAAISAAEVAAAISRRSRLGSVSAREAADAIRNLRSDFHTDYEIVEITWPVIERAIEAAKRHSLRGYDSVQLAAALTARTAVPPGSTLNFVSCDLELNSAAAAEGFVVENPNTSP